jgi:preprotein translocase subunit SecD
MGSDVLQRIVVVGVVACGAILALLPTALKENFTAKWFTKPIALGLDISGGVHLVYGVKAKEAVKSRLQTSLQGMRSELRAKKIAVSQGVVTDDNTVRITLLTDAFLEDGKKLLQEKYSPELTLSRQESDGGRPVLVYGIEQPMVERIQREAIEQSVETLRARVDQFGVAEPLIQRSGEDRIILQMPGVSDVAAVKKVVGSVAKLEFRLLPGTAQTGVGTTSLKSKDGPTVLVEDQVMMAGDSVTDAKVDFQDDGKIGVSLQLSSVGREIFGRVTTENVGRQMAIILDGVVQTSPVIQEPITGGTAFISGSYTTDEAKQLKVVLKAGALPAPLEVLEERTVGPTLGLESVKAGVVAMGVGFVAISLFMMVYYKLSGVIAVGTLILNAILMLGVLSLFGATLTLPGLAGLALTIGMAVDSNVIIFERIRDEIRAGVGRNVAVDSGFAKAFSAIFDANVTTLLAGGILYYFGTGPVKGFAVTLCVGIATTLFCAVYVGRLCFDYFTLKSKEGLSI